MSAPPREGGMSTEQSRQDPTTENANLPQSDATVTPEKGVYEQPTAWTYKRAPFKGKTIVSLTAPYSNDTCTTIKYEYSLLAPEVERAAAIIRQNPDITISDLAEFPEVYKRCGDDHLQQLIQLAADTERRLSVRQFCLQVLADVSRYPLDTVKKYLYAESRQKQQVLPGRPPKK